MDEYEERNQLYVMKNGKYVKANDPYALDGLRKGHWHVWVREGCISVAELIEPSRAFVEAAIKEASEAMVKAMRKESELKPQKRETTVKERKAWKAYKEIAGVESLTLTRESIQGIVDAGIVALREHIKKG